MANPQIQQHGNAQVAQAAQKKKKEGKKLIDPNESKSDRFRRLANVRVPGALKRIGHVKNLAFKSTYDYTPEQAAKIVAALEDAVKLVRQAFSGSSVGSNGWSL